ncbi:MAG: molybdate ABC transporter substrate-binding protein [Sulfitobacter sp.]|nr:molybdate ABC transporter substrate-binding protein [Sulfitobacter sp.]
MRQFAALLILIMTLCAPGWAGAERLVVFAAASLRGALDEIAAGFDGEVALSYGGSGAIARQVAAGAPADAMLLANPKWMDWLEGEGIIAPGTAFVIASNRLVLIGPQDHAPIDPEQLPELLGTGRLAMGQRDAVPAGTYARQWLESAGLWEALRTRLAETDNVRAALALVARGQAPFGIVYATDARAEAGVAILYEVPPESHAPIRYLATALTERGQSFLAHLASPAAKAIFAAHGFAEVSR